MVKKSLLFLLMLAMGSVGLLRAQTYDFEDGAIPTAFSNDATHPWTVVTDIASTKCIKSGNAGVASSESSIELTHSFAANGYIAFDFAAFGEGSDGYDWDKCRFYIDGNLIFDYGNHDAWESTLENVTAGNHTFKWTYKKDSSVNPTGDYFAVDNITLAEGDPCVSPNSVDVATVPGSAVVTWNGYAASYTLRYKLTSTSTWTNLPNITDNTYNLTGLAAGNYNVEVQADCNAGNWASSTFSILPPPSSTANWYGYCAYSLDGASWDDSFISFSMQNIAGVSVANSSNSQTYAAAYADGYVWVINTNGALCQAALDNDNMTIENESVLNSGFESDGTATEMAYNPVDEKIYYIIATDSNDSYLKSFSIANPSDVTTIGDLADHLYAFAINSSGQAYGITSDGGFYSVNLTNAQTTFVGSTGVTCAYVQSMAFDMETGELFWAQILDGSNCGLYQVSTTTGSASIIGQVGNGSGAEITGLFSASGNTMPTTISNVVVNGFTVPRWNANPDVTVEVPSGAHYSIASANWYKNGVVMSATDVFNDESAAYNMKVVIAPASGFSFDSNVTVLFNGDANVFDAANSHMSGNNFEASTITYHVADVGDVTIYDFEDYSLQGWTAIDQDGDGNNWEVLEGSDEINYHEGLYYVCSESYINYVGALTPDNWLVSPAAGNYSSISFWACGQDPSYASEVFGVFVKTDGNSWTQVGSDVTVTGTDTEYTFDLSSYSKDAIWVAIRHYHVTDMFRLNLDYITLGQNAGVAENDANVFSVYPNPATSTLYIDGAEGETVSVYDAIGRLVMQEVYNGQLNVSTLEKGIYAVRVGTNVVRFVKE